MRFYSVIKLGSKLPVFNAGQVKNEPMLFSRDVKFSRKVGGPITYAFLEALHVVLERESVRGVLECSP